MSEESEQDWLVEMSPNPDLTALMPYTAPLDSPREVIGITYKEHGLLSPGDLLWVEEECQKGRQEGIEGLFPYGYNPPLPILYVD